MKYISICLFILCLYSFQKNLLKKENETIETEKPQSENELRLAHIRYLYQQYPSINLPFNYLTQYSVSVTDIDAYGDLDALVFPDLPCGIIGVNPDTSNYFGFFYLLPADNAIPALVTYDKSGKLINNELLATSCWQCESDCRSLVRIDENLNIEFRYEYFEFDFDFDKNFCGKYPILANGFIKYSSVDSEGKIVHNKTDSLSFKKLMENPIVHSGD